MKVIGAYEAKTHLPQLLDEVGRGRSITITKHGQPAAVLRPPSPRRANSSQEVVSAIKAARGGMKLSGVNLRDLIEEGRA